MTEHNDIPTQITDDLEDVEAHGLREVAAAAGIGAAVLGAGGAALAASGSAHIGPVSPRVANLAAGVQHNWAVGDTEQLVGDTLQPTTHLASDINRHVVTPTENVAGGAAAGTINVSHAAVNVAGGAVAGTINASHGAVRVAGGAAAGTLHVTHVAVTSVEWGAVNAANAATELATLHLQISADDTNARPTGHITVSDRSGHTIAQANVVNGTSTVRVDPKVAATITFHPETQQLATASIQWKPQI